MVIRALGFEPGLAIHRDGVHGSSRGRAPTTRAQDFPAVEVSPTVPARGVRPVTSLEAFRERVCTLEWLDGPVGGSV